jgi:hypothetical protein
MADGARRLWQLDPCAHDVLLASSFEPAQLRALLARVLGRMHRGRCVLRGSDADVLYSVVKDLGTRNPLSEALHQALQRRHAVELARWRRVRGEAALQHAWCEALAADDAAPPAAALWALLTHPEGQPLETAALCEFRQRAWALAQQAMQGRQQAARAEAAMAEQRRLAESLQQRLLALQRENVQLQQRLKAAEAQARGAAQRALAAEAALQSAQRARPQAAPAGAPEPRAVSGEGAACAARPPIEAAAASPPETDASATPLPWHDEAKRPERPERPEQPERRLAAAGLQVGARPRQAPAAAAGPSTPATVDPVPPRAAPAVAGRRVLCVGGMPGARQRYRSLVEAAGARFEYHDGGLEDSVARLDSQLVAADLVVCHSGCLNHEAYRRIKGHCQRADKPCVFLARPSLSAFARGLGLRAHAGEASGSDLRPAPTRSPFTVSSHSEGRA